MKDKIVFSQEFLWGSSTSAYQVEGGINNADWSDVFPAGRACNHYELYESDFDLIKDLNQNAHRISIEWSRIEPKEGVFDKEAIDHYRKVLEALKKRGLVSMVTLFHFTSPLWFSQKGGWAKKDNIIFFERFTKVMVQEYSQLVDFWITINEPLIYSYKSFIEGAWPPQKKSPLLFLRSVKNQILAHKKAFNVISKIDNKAKIGMAVNNQSFKAYRNNSFLDKISVFTAEFLNNEYFLNQILNELHFIGLNYYFSRKIKFPFRIIEENREKNDLGWTIDPEGIHRVLIELHEYGLPIYITENGLADKNDKLRKDFIKDHLYWIYQSIEEGVDVRGYFHWSLLDNFEWDKGFDPRFGLVEVDYKNFNRIIRSSAYYYSKICKMNNIDI